MNKIHRKENNVAIALVANFKFLRKHFNRLLMEIRNYGKFDGEVIVITSIFCPTFLIKYLDKKNNVKVIRFKKIKFSKQTEYSLDNLETYLDPNRNKTKKFQWHKLHLFDEKLKNWDSILYLDINMHIHFDLMPILDINVKDKFLARADSYPKYDKDLSTQFDNTNFLFLNLNDKYDLSIKHYFQTGVMLYDTELIDLNTKQNIINIVEEFPISTTNEQGILNLFFIHHLNKYEELPSYIEDYRTYFYWKQKGVKTIITKQNREQYK